MTNLRWILCLFLVPLAKCDDEQNEQAATEVEEEVEEGPAFVPTQFKKPELAGDQFYFDYFPSRHAIGKKWVKSNAKKDGVDADIAKYNGEWEIGHPTDVVIEGDFGLIVKNKARHHAIASKLNKPFKFAEEDLVVQYEAKFENGQECGGGYMKLLSEGAEGDISKFQDKTPYTIMFGPDKCGAGGKVHLIFRYKNPKNGSIDEYHAKQPSNLGTTYWDDHNVHLYTLVLKPNGDFNVLIDQKSIFYGNMLTDLVPPLAPPKEISDPADKKPDDWDEREQIEDVDAVKPDDWDESEPKEVVDENAVKPSDWNEEEPELIADPEAVKPADWDADMDGDWEAPNIDNPACKGISGCGTWKRPVIANPKYKGKWVRPRIANPAYKGKWTARLIENPHYFEPTAFGGLAPITVIGIELWTMSENIIFDNFLITSSEEVANSLAKETFVFKRSEEARLAASKGQGGGMLKAVVDAANERPWLWAVYVLCVLIPVILFGVCCFGQRSRAVDNADAAHKKNDDYQDDDDKVPNLVGDDDENAGDSASESTSDSKKTSPKVNDSVAAAMKNIEDDSSGSATDTEPEADEVKEEQHLHSKNPEPTKRAPRRARRQE